MSVYTDIPQETIQQWATELNLGAVQSVTAASHGIQNSNYFVAVANKAQDSKYVLTVIETLEADTVAMYLSIFDKLAQSNVPIPAAIPRGAPKIFMIENKAAAWFPFFAGDHPSIPTHTQVMGIAEALGKLHRSAQTIDHAALPKPLPKLIALHPQPWMKASEREWLQGKLDTLDEFYRAWPGLSSGIIHSDLFRDNTLYNGDVLNGVLDFYDIKYGPYLCDLAITLNDWCLIPQSNQPTQLSDAFLNTYNTTHGLPHYELRWLKHAQLDAAIRFWYSRTLQMWRITHSDPNLAGHDPNPMRTLADTIETELIVS